MNKEIWNDQLKFNKEFFKDQGFDLKNLSVKDKVKWAKEFHFHICRELADLVNCFPEWKMHYKRKGEIDNIIQSNIKEEFTDAIKYLMGLGQVLGLTYNDVISGYNEKTEVVKQRYRQDKIFEKLKEKEVIVFDIDGVINDYPICFLNWVKRNYNISYKNILDLKDKVDIKTYNEIKEKYRTSGIKRNLPVREETIYVMKELKKRGETIILYTVRPVSKYKRIFPDTLYWLKKNNIPFDAIFCSDYHKEDIYKFGFKIKFIVEDDKQNTALFNHEGYKVFLLNNEYNKNYEHELTTRIYNPEEILRYDKTKRKHRSKVKKTK